jgi:hypothetical protein
MDLRVITKSPGDELVAAADLPDKNQALNALKRLIEYQVRCCLFVGMSSVTIRVGVAGRQVSAGLSRHSALCHLLNESFGPSVPRGNALSATDEVSTSGSVS